MFKKCRHCKTTYIEQDEEICVDCSIFFTEKNEHHNNLDSEMIVEEYGDNEFLNDKGASLIRK